MKLATSHDPGPRGRFGTFGGQYVAETLMPALAELEAAWRAARVDEAFGDEVALYFRDDAPLLGPPPIKGSEPPSEPVHAAIRERLQRGASFWSDLLADIPEAGGAAVEPVELQEALWDLVWAGEVTNDAWAPLRAPKLSLARAANQAAAARRGRFARRRRPAARSS